MGLFDHRAIHFYSLSCASTSTDKFWLAGLLISGINGKNVQWNLSDHKPAKLN